MKIGDRLFPYPILSNINSDYKSSSFGVASGQFEKTLETLTIHIRLDLKCDVLEDLISCGSAKYAIQLECPRTSYRELLQGYTPNFMHSIRLDRLDGSLQLTALILAGQDLDAFTSQDLATYMSDMTFQISKGSILAFVELPEVQIDHQLRNIGSGKPVFVIHKREVSGDVPITVDIDCNSIMIGLRPQEYESYLRLSTEKHMQAVINAAVVFPALVYAIEQLRGDEEMAESHNSLEWFRTIAKAYSDQGLPFLEMLNGENSLSSVEIAQELMHLPVQSAFSSLIFFDSSETDEEEQ